MTSPTIIVFDIGNVLLDWSPAHLYRRLIPDDGLRAAFFARLPLDEMNLAGDRDGGCRRRWRRWRSGIRRMRR